VLDVGQGDAILLEPPGGAPLLVDGGPPGDDLRGELETRGISELAAAIVTHDQSDHAGGIVDLLATFPVHRVLYGQPGRGFLTAARAARVPATSIAQGYRLTSKALRLDVLWPPRRLLGGAAPIDPNQAALVLLVRWHGFRMLLTADAEAEAVPIEPGPIDVLKVAHHGSEDGGLDGLLDRAIPSLAVISAGAENPYGHPAPPTLAVLGDHDVPVLRTDESGDVTIEVAATAGRVEPGEDAPWDMER
jgi:competence protein ComEC